jgi:hypothetical protein
VNVEIKAEVERRGISRVCHFTPLRNLVHITTSGGLVSTSALKEQERRAFNQQDLQRLDQHPDHISCSIQYPNAWYFRSKSSERGEEAALFRTWVVLILPADLLWADATLFCHQNAAAGRGTDICAGIDCFNGLFADAVTGTRGRTFRRQRTRLLSFPTNDQAEALIYRHVKLSDVRGIAVRDEDQARSIFAGLRQIGGRPDRFPFSIAPLFFEPTALSAMIARGECPDEKPWDPNAYV